MIPRASRALAASMLMLLVGSACSSKADGTDAAIRQYCDSLLASPAYACCSAADRADGQFVARNRYSSAGDCSAQLLLATGQNKGRRAFDAAAAASCLGYLSTRACPVLPTSAVRIAEETAGCNRVVVGVQDEGKPCDTSEDCSVGLFCPPVKDTGVSACARPAAATQSCLGDLALHAIDHPPCQPGLFCQLIGENPGGCPSPPCLDFRCVPFFEEGEACTGLECAAGLACNDGTCRKTGPSAPGAPCRLTENCAEGLYCDPNGACEPRKRAGEACRNPADSNAAFECKGICSGEGPSVCVAFCGSN
jgi:hypothetical protein